MDNNRYYKRIRRPGETPERRKEASASAQRGPAKRPDQAMGAQRQRPEPGRENEKKAAKKRKGGNQEFGKTAITVLICIAAVLAVIFGTLYAVNTSQLDGTANLGQPPPSPSQSVIPSGELNKLTVLVDAGHGGFDPGTIAPDGTHEDGLNLSVALKLKDELEKRGHTVELTRPDENALGQTKDEDMDNRAKIIHDSLADVLISVHMDSYVDDSSVSGPTTIYYPGAEESKELAGFIQKSLIEGLDPVKKRKIKSDNLMVLRSGEAPAVLVECGFLTNYEELEKLKEEEYQIKVAQCIADGLEQYAAQRAQSIIPQ